MASKAAKTTISSQNFLLNIVNALEDPIFVKDEEHRWIFLNDAACKLMGLSREELIGKTGRDLFEKGEFDVFWETDCRVLETGETCVNQETITWQGKQHIIATSKSLYQDPATGQKFITGTIRDVCDHVRKDEEFRRSREKLERLVEKRGKQLLKTNERLKEEITERRKARLAVQESELKYRTVVEEASDGIYIIQEGRFVYGNDAFCDILGYTREELGQMEDSLALVHKDSWDFIKWRNKMMEHGEKVPPRYEFTGKHKSGLRVYVDASIVTISYKEKPARLGIIRDITARKEHQRQLTNVITNTSHLINTPLTVALGQMDMVKLGLKEFSEDLTIMLHDKLTEICQLVRTELISNLYKLTEETSDGWTPVVKSEEENQGGGLKAFLI